MLIEVDCKVLTEVKIDAPSPMPNTASRKISGAPGLRLRHDDARGVAG